MEIYGVIKSNHVHHLHENIFTKNQVIADTDSDKWTRKVLLFPNEVFDDD
jgi:hypothetical protein